VVELQLARRRRVPELLPTTHHLADLVDTTLLLPPYPVYLLVQGWASNTTYTNNHGTLTSMHVR
jgi:hypothetical protein